MDEGAKNEFSGAGSSTPLVPSSSFLSCVSNIFCDFLLSISFWSRAVTSEMAGADKPDASLVMNGCVCNCFDWL
ncbi:hypothetical protein ACW5XW_08510 [Aeromonas piscicola]